MDRILKGASATISQTLYIDGTATDPAPDSAMVQILRDDGTELVASTAATNAGTGGFTYTLTPAQTTSLDRLTAKWTMSIGGQSQTLETKVEIAGGFLFSINEAKADSALTSKTAAEIATARTKAEQDLERACRVAFVPRYESQTLSGDGSSFLQIRWPQIRTIRSVTVDGTSISVSDLDPSQAGLYNPSGWTRGVSNIVVRYEHGYDPGEIQTNRAALRLAKHYLLGTPTDDRAVRMDTDVGSYALATAGLRGARFGIPEVDAFVQAERYVLSVA